MKKNERLDRVYTAPCCETLILTESLALCTSPSGDFDDFEVGDHDWDED